MSYIPNARGKYTEQLYKNTRGASAKPEPNPYWHGLNDDYGKSELFGFDEAVGALNNLFDNLDVYETEIEEIFGEGALEQYDEMKTDGESPYAPGTNGYDEPNPKYRDLNTYEYEERQKMSQITKAMLLFKRMANNWLEMERDEINVSLLDNLDNKQYDRNFEEFTEKIADEEAI